MKNLKRHNKIRKTLVACGKVKYTLNRTETDAHRPNFDSVCYCWCDLAPPLESTGGLRLDSHLSPLSTETTRTQCYKNYIANTMAYLTVCNQKWGLLLLHKKRKPYLLKGRIAILTWQGYWHPSCKSTADWLRKDELKNWGREVTVCNPHPSSSSSSSDSFAPSLPSIIPPPLY